MHVVIYNPVKIPPDNYGGTERVVWWLIKGLSKLGCKVTFIGPKGSYHPHADIIEVDIPKGDPSLNPLDLKPFLPPDTDILHIHHFSFLDYGVPVLKTFHSIPNERFRFLIDDFTSFLSNTHRKVSGAPNNPFVYNGLDPDDYLFSEEKDEYLLFLSKVDRPEKGIHVAVEVAKRLGLKLIIAGNTSSNSFYKEKLKPIMSKNMEYVGPVGGKIKAELLARAKALIFPTLWPEPFGLVVIEALVSGTPVITTFNGAMPEIMIQGKTGFMCNSLEEMVEAVKFVDKVSPYLCRRHVLKHFTYTRMATRYLSLYKAIINAFTS